jgi:hypothetical protein
MMQAFTFAVSLFGEPFGRPAPGRLPPLLRGGDGFASLFFKAAAGAAGAFASVSMTYFSVLTAAMLEDRLLCRLPRAHGQARWAGEFALAARLQRQAPLMVDMLVVRPA